MAQPNLPRLLESHLARSGPQALLIVQLSTVFAQRFQIRIMAYGHIQKELPLILACFTFQRSGNQCLNAILGRAIHRGLSPDHRQRNADNHDKRDGKDEQKFSHLYPTQTRALRNIRSQGPSSCQWSGRQELVTERNTRSGCGIMMVMRPSLLVKPVIPAMEPLGLNG